jgi:hypothetical protein
VPPPDWRDEEHPQSPVLPRLIKTKADWGRLWPMVAASRGQDSGKGLLLPHRNTDSSPSFQPKPAIKSQFSVKAPAAVVAGARSFGKRSILRSCAGTNSLLCHVWEA